jgi:hypothetical protein
MSGCGHVGTYFENGIFVLDAGVVVEPAVRLSENNGFYDAHLRISRAGVNREIDLEVPLWEQMEQTLRFVQHERSRNGVGQTCSHLRGWLSNEVFVEHHHDTEGGGVVVFSGTEPEPEGWLSQVEGCSGRPEPGETSRSVAA